MGEVEKITVGIADLKVSKTSRAITTVGLGSCVGITIYDKYKKIGGLAHVMLADSRKFNNNKNKMKFADTAIPLLISELVKLGANKRMLEAKIAGGASMFNFSDNSIMNDIGKNNVEMVKEVLVENKIPLVSSDVGGNKGRNMTLDIETGEVIIEMVGNDRLKKFKKGI
ncbi:chemotaxis protein CheD [Clostridium massiliamazoniense]|uniref:chemotaxis protein CheD n=1 Tax=Clostridium massiliamazoniense TaxID=1347366 RepID=UPI0006D7C6E3|nr:chemotaxis protein CheD [Clostridium massiliamazoniense]